MSAADYDEATVASYRKSKATAQTRRGFGLMLGTVLRNRWVTPGTGEVDLELGRVSTSGSKCD